MGEVKNTKNTGRNFSIIMALVLGILATVLVVQNSNEVSIRLWFWQLKSSLIILLAITLGLGMLVAYLLMVGKVTKLKKDNRRLRKKLGSPEKNETGQKSEGE